MAIRLLNFFVDSFLQNKTTGKSHSNPTSWELFEERLGLTLALECTTWKLNLQWALTQSFTSCHSWVISSIFIKKKLFQKNLENYSAVMTPHSNIEFPDYTRLELDLKWEKKCFYFQCTVLQPRKCLSLISTKRWL